MKVMCNHFAQSIAAYFMPIELRITPHGFNMLTILNLECTRMTDVDREQQLRQQGWKEQPGVGPFVELIGPLWVRQKDGENEYGLQIQTKHLNSNGIVHGGMLMSVIDQVVSHVIWDKGDKTPMATIDMSTNFIDAVREGEWMSATAQVQRRTRSLVFVTGQICVGERICLSAQAIMKLRTK